MTLSQKHELLREVDEHSKVLQRRLSPGEAVLDAQPVDPPKGPPRRPMIEIMLDPRNIQWLLTFGGVLMVIGLVILLWVNEFFTPPVVAGTLGVVNLLVLVGGWYVVRKTRYEVAGRALTLIASLIMPLNLWYYQTKGLLTLTDHLWMAGVVMSLFYVASALVLRDSVLVFVQNAGVTLAGLLILASLPPSPEKFWEIAAPSTMLIVLGLICIHLERAFPEQEGPFSRKRFGLAYFWSGHVQLAGGLLLLLGAFIAGDWLYKPLFEQYYKQWQAGPSPVIGSMRWLSLLLVLVGIYAYVYSDIVVRQVGVYVHFAAVLLLWALIIAVEMLPIAMGIDVLIGMLALTALVVNLVQARFTTNSPYTRAFPIFGVVMPLLAVVLGGLVYFRAVSLDLRSIWQTEPPTWNFVMAMAITAITCRVGAHLYRDQHKTLSLVYFFATGAATLIGAAALLAAVQLGTWEQHAPILMLLPIIYLVAAHLYHNTSPARPLLWVSHAGTGVMLLASLASTQQGFRHLVQAETLNLSLAIFFAEVALFYILAATLHRQALAVHLAAIASCGAVWQLMVYAGVTPEYHILTFALVGLVLLIAYRFAVLEKFANQPLADASFQAGNTLVSLACIGAALLSASRLLDQPRWEFITLCLILTGISLLAIVLVKHQAWRRWYVVTTVAEGLLAFLGLTLLSQLSGAQKLEIFCVLSGLLLLIVGHIGWYREHERHNDLASMSLVFGALLVSVPLAIASMVDRWQDEFRVLNELGFLAAGLILLTTGVMFQIRSTTLVGALTTVLYFLTLLIFVPWGRLNALAWFILVGGGMIFSFGLILSVFRERLLTMPDRIKHREGVFRVLNWR
ncbi:MAG: hypothetical protein U0840_25400 [Gemmataceae bacterium]